MARCQLVSARSTWSGSSAGRDGVVYLAWDPRLERRVALKALPRSSSPTPSGAPVGARAKALAAASHPTSRESSAWKRPAQALPGARIRRRREPRCSAMPRAAAARRGARAGRTDCRGPRGGARGRRGAPRPQARQRGHHEEGRVKILDFGLATGSGSATIPGSEPTLVDSPVRPSPDP